MLLVRTEISSLALADCCQEFFRPQCVLLPAQLLAVPLAFIPYHVNGADNRGSWYVT